MFDYIESPVIRSEAMEGAGRRTGILNTQVGYQNTGGRIHRARHRGKEKAKPGRHSDIMLTLDWMDAMGVDYSCMFPTPMLFLGLHPQVEIETAMCRAYNAWLCEKVLAQEPRIVSMLYLPFNDPEAAYRTVKDFGDKKGCVGFMVTSPRYKPVHDNAYMKTYALLEEMGKPISFHAAYSWEDRALQMTNRFISVHALGFMWFNMIHMTNWVVNGLPVRFPKLKVMWIESGLTWAASLMQRLDHSFMMRTSDAPLLQGEAQPLHAADVLLDAADGNPRRQVGDGSDLQDDQRRDAAGLVVRLSALGLRPAVDDLRPAVPQRDQQAQHPRRQRGAAVRARSQAGEEDSVAARRATARTAPKATASVRARQASMRQQPSAAGLRFQAEAERRA